MLLAGAAAIIVAFFGVVNYKSKKILTVPTPTPPSSWTVWLDSQNKSGETGNATLQQIDGKVLVRLIMTGFPATVSQTTYIHSGTCALLGGVKYPLAPVVNGKSETTLDVTLDQF